MFLQPRFACHCIHINSRIIAHLQLNVRQSISAGLSFSRYTCHFTRAAPATLPPQAAREEPSVAPGLMQSLRTSPCGQRPDQVLCHSADSDARASNSLAVNSAAGLGILHNHSRVVLNLGVGCHAPLPADFVVLCRASHFRPSYRPAHALPGNEGVAYNRLRSIVNLTLALIQPKRVSLEPSISRRQAHSPAPSASMSCLLGSIVAWRTGSESSNQQIHPIPGLLSAAPKLYQTSRLQLLTVTWGETGGETSEAILLFFVELLTL